MLQRFVVGVDGDELPASLDGFYGELLPNCLKLIHVHNLELQVNASSCFQLLELLRNLPVICNLRIEGRTYDDEPPDNENNSIPQLNDHLDFRSLRSLSIQGDNLSFLSALLNWIRLGEEFRSLEILSSPILFQWNSDQVSRHTTSWGTLVPNPSSEAKCSQVTTLIINWPSRWPDFIQALAILTPSIRSLVFRIQPHDLEDDSWSLAGAHLAPSQDGDHGIKAPFPRLECIRIIIETSGRRIPSINTIEEDFLPKLEAALPDLLNSRLRSGADPIRKVILQSFSTWDYPEVRNFPQANGVLLQLEACRGDGPRDY